MWSALKRSKTGFLGQRTAVIGLGLYAIFAPHSVAAADIAIAIAIVGWLLRTIATRSTGLTRTRFDLPIILFLLWTVASSVLSEEPAISIAKLEASWAALAFYLAQAVVTRWTARVFVLLLIASGVAGTFYSVYDVARGRGIIVESITAGSPFEAIGVRPGDAIWRIDGHRIYSTAEIDQIIRDAPADQALVVGMITNGEHIERPGLLVTNQVKNLASPSGVIGSSQTHRFRASGWTRHYETFSELLQVIAQLALGIALANVRRHGLNVRFNLFLAAFFVLGLGIALTAMRTVLVAFALAACLIVFRSLKSRARLVLVAIVAIVVGLGAFIVSRTRPERALALSDASSFLRLQVAKQGVSRIILHPLFGHGMDAMHLHWNEWGFPGRHMLHMHSTPLQIAFDRGLPALFIWIWLLTTFWLAAARGEQAFTESPDTDRHGILLGIVGALTGLLLSSLVNYNFGDAEVALLFWWLMGVMVELSKPQEATVRSHQQSSFAYAQTTSNRQ